VVSDDGGEQLGWLDGVLLGEDVACLLLGVGCDDDRVVSLGVAVCGLLAILLEMVWRG
jgi:hypothetical protein